MRIRTSFFLRHSLLLTAFFCVSGVSAYAQCADPWVTQSVKAVKGSISGTGAAGDCNPANYGGGHWTTYADLLSKVQAHFRASAPAPAPAPAPVAAGQCTDPWVTQAVRAVKGSINGSATTGDCNPRNYGGGQWTSYADLQTKVNAYFHPPVAAPAPPPPVAARPVEAAAPAVVRMLVGANQCLGVEGGSYSQGARLIRWACTSAPDQQFRFMPDGTLRTYSGNGLCVDDKGGLGHPNDSIDTWACNGNRGQQWRLQNYTLVSPFGLCLAIRGGFFVGNADALLSACSGTQNQTVFNWGQDVSRPGAQAVLSGGGQLVQPGGFIALQPGTASGAGNIVASGAGNIVASGAGNIVASGAGNIVASGAGN